MNTKNLLAAVAALLGSFLGAAESEAGKTGIDRTRPGAGFHNQDCGRASASSRSWTMPQLGGGPIVRTPRVEALIGDSEPRHGDVERDERVAAK